MSLKKNPEFQWYDYTIIPWMIYDPARTIHGLLQRIEDVPPSSIHFHMHHTYIWRPYVGTTFFNDFANWAKDHLKDDNLAEKLSMVIPSQYNNIEDVRHALVAILENYLIEIGQELRFIGRADPFCFMDYRAHALPSGPKVSTLKEWIKSLKEAPLHSIYFHFYETHWYPEGLRHQHSPSYWLKSIGEAEAALAIDQFDPFVWNLLELKHDLIETAEQFA